MSTAARDREDARAAALAKRIIQRVPGGVDECERHAEGPILLTMRVGHATVEVGYTEFLYGPFCGLLQGLSDFCIRMSSGNWCGTVVLPFPNKGNRASAERAISRAATELAEGREPVE